jgi:hypothetical protein
MTSDRSSALLDSSLDIQDAAEEAVATAL